MKASNVSLARGPARFVLLLMLSLAAAGVLRADDWPPGIDRELREHFAMPPLSAGPWVYWFWVDGNVNREGITADLESMQRVGIGGVILFCVDQGAPKGPVEFGGAEWTGLFHFACAEASRLGLEVNMDNSAGWCGTAGPWITPKLSMQKLVWTSTAIRGPQHFSGALAEPEKIRGYYEDSAVVAFPTPAAPCQIPNLAGLTFQTWTPPYTVPLVYPAIPAGQTVPSDRVLDLTARLEKGTLDWDVPAGDWTVLRMGHTSTGMMNHPSPAGGLGLESDKLSQAATDTAFNGLIAKLTAEVGPLAGKTLVSTHIDSWESGMQNWTSLFREQFRALRGYDPTPYLPVLTGQAIGNAEVSQRFLWDFRQTICEGFNRNYVARMRDLAHQKGLRLSIEAYTKGPFNEMSCAGQSDEPMGEFWWPTLNSGPDLAAMAFAAHAYGKPIVGAEAFTAQRNEKWLCSPLDLKPLGDWAFCEGINRLAFHRFAMQAWPGRAPGMAMGPWGQHYDRTQTWWEQSAPWHAYVARCQYLLRQGVFHADICHLEPEGFLPTFVLGSSAGRDSRPSRNFDGCTPDALLTRMSVKDGQLVLPDGVSYRLLVLPDDQVMTPGLLKKIAELIRAGATVIGPRPEKSPGLTGYPGCDDQLKALAAQVWGDCDGRTVKEHAYGAGRVIWGRTPEEVLDAAGVLEDFAGDAALRPWLNYNHRILPDGSDVYFVANRCPAAVDGVATFGIRKKWPVFGWPESGKMEPAAVYRETVHGIEVPLHLVAHESVFVIFPAGPKPFGPLLLTQPELPPDPTAADPEIIVQKATYGIPDDPAHSRDTREQVQTFLNSPANPARVGDLARTGDPAPNRVKILSVELTKHGVPRTFNGMDRDPLLVGEDAGRGAEVKAVATGQWELEAWRAGRYTLKTAVGNATAYDVEALPRMPPLAGSWEVSFAPDRGAPDKTVLPELKSWSESTDLGIKYFSGTAVYRKNFTMEPASLPSGAGVYMDLGAVAVMAKVILNGKDLGVLWKPPYTVDVTRALRPGENSLEVQVTNLWVNRMIGDEQLPEDSPRADNGTIKGEWPDWVLKNQPSPTGRYTFTTWRLWKKDSPLQKSGLLGPVTFEVTKRIRIVNP